MKHTAFAANYTTLKFATLAQLCACGAAPESEPVVVAAPVVLYSVQSPDLEAPAAAAAARIERATGVVLRPDTTGFPIYGSRECDPIDVGRIGETDIHYDEGWTTYTTCMQITPIDGGLSAEYILTHEFIHALRAPLGPPLAPRPKDDHYGPGIFAADAGTLKFDDAAINAICEAQPCTKWELEE